MIQPSMNGRDGRSSSVTARSGGDASCNRPPAGDQPPSGVTTGFIESVQELAGHAPLVLAGLAVAAVGVAPLAEAWFIASRLAYVLYVGLSLRAESRTRALSRRAGPEAAWSRFRARASKLMLGDALAFGALCVVTRGTFDLPGPSWLGLAAGLLLIALGIGTKTWATAHLPDGSFYWRDFFVQPAHTSRSTSGPYRWLSNPMYSVGYSHAYGFALLTGSGPGLAAAAFAQLAVLLLATLVERPHVRRLAPAGMTTSARATPPPLHTMAARSPEEVKRTG